MNLEKWETIRQCAALESLSTQPVALIVDSPWIPGYLNISMMDYFSMPDIWLQANLEIERQFPEAIFLPGFWIEVGMAAEPSGFGCKVNFFADKTPLVHSLSSDMESVSKLAQPNPRRDGLMPWILNYYRNLEARIEDAGHSIKMVAARGPLAIASHLMGVSEFLVGLKLDPQNTHRLLSTTTKLAKDWLEAQSEVLSAVEGIMLLDDIVGFLSPKDYLEFAHPYLKKIFDAFPGTVKVLHNDMDNAVSYPYLEELGVQIFNLTHKIGLKEARHHVGANVCLMGNVAPLDVLCNSRPKEVKEHARHCLETHPEHAGLILSAGGGVSPGTPGENIQALIEVANSYRKGALQ